MTEATKLDPPEKAPPKAKPEATKLPGESRAKVTDGNEGVPGYTD